MTLKLIFSYLISKNSAIIDNANVNILLDNRLSTLVERLYPKYADLILNT